MYILGISAYYHDSAACLIKDGTIVAAVQEERFSRIKNDASFPEEAIKYCLSAAGIALTEVDHVVFYEKPFLKFERLLDTIFAFAPYGLRAYLKAMPIWIKDKLFTKGNISKALQQIDQNWKYREGALLFCEHHFSHAASAFFVSPFEKAAILTVDGAGEWVTSSIAVGHGNNISRIKHINFPHSLGLLYSAFTYYLGFKVNCDEYKVMGLAPYGKPVYSSLIYKCLVDVKADGSFRINMNFFNYAAGLTMVNQNFVKLFGNKIRQKDETITKFHMDVAASIQNVTEEILLRIAWDIKAKTGCENLCMAGGVALNCVANGKLLRSGIFKNIWVQPAAGDAGGAVGAAMFVYYQHLQNKRQAGNENQMQQMLLGPEFNVKEIEETLNKLNIRYHKLNPDNYLKTVAGKIAEGMVVGWFSGRMEFGPRALGARSILADPRDPGMQSKLNLKIKFRESFRPFAPAVLQKYCHVYFNLRVASPYMLFTAPVSQGQLDGDEDDSFAVGVNTLNEVRTTIPAVTHVDYSARVQTVDELNGSFYHLLQAFYLVTGCPMLINTSFNVMDEPIVCTPDDAVSCFLKTDMDLLAFENILIYKSENLNIH
ncbi:carbamoyltransferase family protein [Mucilaginibacter sp. KACC 22063]|uniref:carbamoyltransferase family protein n=1 Tax=Mucilaginibacter sp. KACC 22063 TaxID=3025666 RepID=UPI00236577E4|nr:carbamoyltransferase [Mucilaginibacter sp. KACC 22063]WDF57279.1 carbamoyltransferase [Mucilaginibacter sp. KACC 22063]